MNISDATNLGCYFCVGVCGVNLLATIGRAVPEVGLVLVGILVVAATVLAVSCNFYPQITPTATYLTLIAIIGLILGVVN